MITGGLNDNVEDNVERHNINERVVGDFVLVENFLSSHYFHTATTTITTPFLTQCLYLSKTQNHSTSTIEKFRFPHLKLVRAQNTIISQRRQLSYFINP
jgi:hypothetical protein